MSNQPELPVLLFNKGNLETKKYRGEEEMFAAWGRGAYEGKILPTRINAAQ